MRDKKWKQKINNTRKKINNAVYEFPVAFTFLEWDKTRANTIIGAANVDSPRHRREDWIQRYPLRHPEHVRLKGIDDPLRKGTENLETYGQTVKDQVSGSYGWLVILSAAQIRLST